MCPIDGCTAATDRLHDHLTGKHGLSGETWWKARLELLSVAKVINEEWRVRRPLTLRQVDRPQQWSQSHSQRWIQSQKSHQRKRGNSTPRLKQMSSHTISNSLQPQKLQASPSAGIFWRQRGRAWQTFAHPKTYKIKPQAS